MKCNEKKNKKNNSNITLPTQPNSSRHACKSSAFTETVTVRSSTPARQRQSCWRTSVSSPDSNIAITDSSTSHVETYVNSRMLRTNWAPTITACNSFNKTAALLRCSSERLSGKSLSEIMLTTFFSTDRRPSSTCLPCDGDEISMWIGNTSPSHKHTDMYCRQGHVIRQLSNLCTGTPRICNLYFVGAFF